ncbi:MAG: acetate--CoA ligase family protein [Dehalococcoidia bacterium]|nr:acetate--CoA ligase family protein [Dehalococcoidia bacterium]
MDFWSEAQLASIHKMLNPRSIAVVGATERPQYGGRFLRAALQAGDRVSVYPVNPRYDELLGLKCYASVLDLPEAPDAVGIIVPYHRVIPVLRESAERGAGSAIVISAGFSERGVDDRRELQAELGDVAKETGVRISGPNCLGLANIKDDIWACSSSRLEGVELRSGNVGLVCQSGASAFGPFMSRAIGRGVGYSYIVSTGNEADLEAPDFGRYLLDDDDTSVIAMFIEGFKDARKFLEVARLAAERGKPIVAVKIGRSDLGMRAARSHTAALTGVDEVYDAAFEQYGVIRVHDWDKLLEIAQLLSVGKSPANRGISLVSHSGGVCSLTADNLGDAGLELPELTDPARDAINNILEGFGWAANPADITGHASRDTVLPIMEHMISEPEVGTLVVASSASDAQAQHVIDVRDRHDELVTFLYTGNELGASTGLDRLKDAGVPVFHSPENLASALKQFHDYHSWRQSRHGSDFGSVAPMDDTQSAFAARIKSGGETTLSEHEAKQLIQQWDVTVATERVANSEDEALAAAREIGYPVVVKVNSPDILHKTEAGALRVGLTSDYAVRAAYEEVVANSKSYSPGARLEGVLVGEMVRDAAEVIVGVTYDSQLGPVLLFGMGGVLVEVMRDVALRVCPISRQDAEEMVAQVRGSRLLHGFRGQPKGDVDALVDTLVRVSDLAVHLDGVIEELDINPLAVLPEGSGVKALDALVTLKQDKS